MATFSWTDGLHAVVASCLPCFTSRTDDENNQQGAQSNRSNTSQQRVRQSHRDELEGLLGDILAESDADAETMSLQSNVGGSRTRRSRKKRQRDGRTKHIRVFGYDLFGRPPIHLPESDEEGSSSGTRRKSRRGKVSSAQGTITAASSSTEAFDSDAAPLDSSTLNQLSPQDALRLAQAAQREQELMEAEARRLKGEKEEKRRRRRERRELRKAAAAMGLNDGGFEGFQGSGPGLPGGGTLSPMSSTMASSVAGDQADQDTFGPFVGAGSSTERRVPSTGDDPDAGLADFGGEAYARKSRSRTSGNSDGSRSVTSASQSNADAQAYNYHFLSQQQIQQPQVQTLADLPRKKKSKKSRATTASSPTSQSASLPSPVGSPMDLNQHFAVVNVQDPYSPTQSQPQYAQPMILSPNTQTQFEGFPTDTTSVPSPGFPSVGFPSVGFGGTRRKSIDASAFLAMQGNH